MSGYETITGPPTTCMPNDFCVAVAECPAGKRVVGGGWAFVEVPGPPFSFSNLASVSGGDTTWQALFYNGSYTEDAIFQARAICATA
ncbi:hypothetical protein ACQPZZ_38685 [Microbispora sp. CA-135349]|uniref:hypothetical protein n=1 Tax=Microbispora sp. CA-135349 TaxID=3239953 RepID=UPI003D931112